MLEDHTPISTRGTGRRHCTIAVHDVQPSKTEPQKPKLKKIPMPKSNDNAAMNVRAPPSNAIKDSGEPFLQCWAFLNYSQVQRVDTTLTKRILDKLIENGNFPVLPNLLEGKFLQLAADKIDIIEETLDGKGTFHATQMVAFQRGEPTSQSEQQVPLGKGGFLKTPEELKSS